MKIGLLIGDYYHNENFIRNFLELSFSKVSNIEFINYTCENIINEFDDTLNVMVIARENRIAQDTDTNLTWFTEEFDKKITDYVKKGGNILVIHAGFASYDISSLYIKMLKGYFLTHPEKHEDVNFVTCENKILKESYNFTLFDEQYFVNYNGDMENVFLLNSSSKGKCVAGWSHKYFDGKVICLTPTHNESGFNNKEFIKLMSEIVREIL